MRTRPILIERWASVSLMTWALAACDGSAAGSADGVDADGAAIDVTSETDDAVGPGPVESWSGDYLRNDNAGSTDPRVVSCGGDLFVHWIFNRGLGQVSARLSRGQGVGEPWVELGSYLNDPVVVFACGPQGTLHLVEEEHIVSGSFPNATHQYRYHARRLEGGAWVELGLIREGREPVTGARVLSDGSDVYFVGLMADGLRVWVLDKDAFVPMAGADPVPETTGFGSGLDHDWFDDGQAPWFALTQHTNGVGTGTILSIAGREVTTRYAGPIDVNRDRRWLALDGRLYALRVEGGQSAIVTFPEGTPIATFGAGRELEQVDRVGDAFVGLMFYAALPYWSLGEIVSVTADGRVTDLGRAGPDGNIADFWKLSRVDLGEVVFLEHEGRIHAVLDHIGGSGSVSIHHLLVARHGTP